MHAIPFIKLGVIADDFTGASDIASFLLENGLPTIQTNGVPQVSIDTSAAQALVVSLKSRSIPAAQAVQLSLEALAWLQAQGCSHFFFKYCSTFDSTAEGNIGPVTDALLNALSSSQTIICPSLPVNGRTVCHGYLFVGNQLLNESGMRYHPVTPMTDANLLRLIEAQSRGGHRAGLLGYSQLEAGVEAAQAQLDTLVAQEVRYVVCDTLHNQHLDTIAAAVQHLPLVTGGSGLGGALARLHAHGQQHRGNLPLAGDAVVLAGSCSQMTNKQVAYYQQLAPSLQLEIARCVDEAQRAAYLPELLDFVLMHRQAAYAPLVYATVPPSELAQIQQQYGAATASAAIEATFAQLAVALRAQGVRNFITAGGETSSIVVQALQVSWFEIGQAIAPGVPWLRAGDEDNLYLALKSGNFGQEDFFQTAQDMLQASKSLEGKE